MKITSKPNAYAMVIGDSEEYSGLWEKEEFEDLIARSLIALFETKESKKNKKYPTQFRVNEKELLRIKKFGCYFPPDDRGFLGGELCVNVDGFPKEACISFVSNPKVGTSFAENEYLTIINARKIDKLPGGVLSANRNKPFIKEVSYSLTFLCPTLDGELHIQKTFFTLDQNGIIHDTYFYDEHSRQVVIAATGILYETEQRTDKIWASCVLGLSTDRKYLWNVEAREKKASSTFGVHPEQIKSLFYAREMPMSETGRKRPILHWVAAHQRRIKSGIDIDINKHLRGVNEFVYQGTKFIITNPQKVIK